MTEPDRHAVSRVLAYAAQPRIWRQLRRRDWNQLGAMLLAAAPDEDANRAAVRARHPGWADQADAAASEAYRLAALRVATTPNTMWPDLTAEAALRGHMLRILAGLAGGCLDGCPHADVKAPRPMLAAPWHPRVVCWACSETDPVPPPPDLNHCDLCGRVSLRRRADITSPTVSMVTVNLRVCWRCVERMLAAQT